MRYPTKHPLYDTWRNMMARCYKTFTRNFKHYGGKGITVCEPWKDFETWLDDVGPRPSSKHRLIRLNLAGNYEPSNCKWGLRGEEGSVSRRGREYALRHGTQVSRPLGSFYEAQLERKNILAQTELPMELEVVWRQEGERNWRGHGN